MQGFRFGCNSNDRSVSGARGLVRQGDPRVRRERKLSMTLSAEQKRERTKIERRKSIVEAATRVFHRHGLAAATMEQVAREADVSKGSLYLYFESKDELYLEISTAALRELVEKVSRVHEREFEDGKKWFFALLVAYVNHALSDVGRFLTGIGWLTSSYSVDHNHPMFVEYREQAELLHDISARAVARGQADGSIRVCGDPRLLAIQVWGAALGLIMIENRAQELGRRIVGLPSLSGVVVDFLERLFDSRCDEAR